MIGIFPSGIVNRPSLTANHHTIGGSWPAGQCLWQCCFLVCWQTPLHRCCLEALPNFPSSGNQTKMDIYGIVLDPITTTNENTVSTCSVWNVPPKLVPLRTVNIYLDRTTRDNQCPVNVPPLLIVEYYV